MFIVGAIQISKAILNLMFLLMASDDVSFENMEHMSHRTMRSGYYGSTEPLEMPESNPVFLHWM